jgi:hypothetical protein
MMLLGGGADDGGADGFAPYGADDFYQVPQQQQQQQQPVAPKMRAMPIQMEEVVHKSSPISVAAVQQQQPAPQQAFAAPSGVYGTQGSFGSVASPGAGAAAYMASAVVEPGYWDLLWERRRDVCKLVLLSLVVLLALSSHTTIWHYLKEFIDAASITRAQEVALRVAYPAAVLFVLWHVKAFLTGPGGWWRSGQPQT